MKNNIKIAVIGGTGKSGQYLIKHLIEKGYTFKALVRNPQHFTEIYPLAEIVIGDVTNPDAVHELLKGCNAVISMLGMGLPPGNPTQFANATRNILNAMQAHNILRYIVTTGLNVDTPFDKKSAETAAATAWMRQNFPASTQSKQEEYELLAASTARWTMLRLPMIELTDELRPVSISVTDCPGNHISAASLADFAVRQLFDDSYMRQAPFIADK
jgi:putative NADH-flavin reductase